MSQDLTLFHKFTSQFTDKTMDNVHRIGRNFYLAEANLMEIKNGVKRDIFSVGTYLGEEKMGFSPSPAFIDIIARMPNVADRKVVINKKAEWLFLCGRNVLSDSIIKYPQDSTNPLVLVQNEQDENLGYGLFKKEDTLIIKHILDKGKYLRMDEKNKHKGKKR